MEPISTSTIATTIASGAASFLKGMLKRATGKALDAKIEAELRKEVDAYKSDIEANIQVFLMQERAKYKFFERQYETRNELYEKVWELVDPVSQEQWHQESKKTWNIEQVFVKKLYGALIELNRESGFIFDPTSRGFLLDLRETCKRCSVSFDKKKNLVHWTYDNKPPSFPHGIKLWMAKSALRRSMVRAMQAPIFGDPQYFDRIQQMKIRNEVIEDVKADLKRGHFPRNEITRAIVTSWLSNTSGSGAKKE